MSAIRPTLSLRFSKEYGVSVYDVSSLLFGISTACLGAYYPFTAESSSNTGWDWTNGPNNLLKNSKNLKGGAWDNSATVNSATTATFSAQNQYIRQAVTTTELVNYTLYLTARAVSGNTSLRFLHTDSATGDDSALTLTASLADYSVTVLGKTGGGTVYFGIQDQNVAGFGQIEVTRWMVTPGSDTTLVETTTTGQEVSDYSSNGNHAQNGRRA